MKFKVGDRVRYIAKDYGIEYLNAEGVLTKISSKKTFGYMRFDGDGIELCGSLGTAIEKISDKVKVDGPAPLPESETKVLTDKIAKLEKQVNLLKILLESQGCDKKIISSALELLE